MIRLATPADGKEILKIYSYYVEETMISFEIDSPSIEEFEKRIEQIQKKYPYLVYEEEGKIRGFCYASAHAERRAFAYTVNASIYFEQSYQGKGVAKAMYERLFDLLEKQGFFQVYVGVTSCNGRSLRFHQNIGFEEVGCFEKVGYKFEKWVNLIWLSKRLKQEEESVLPIRLVEDVWDL